MKLFYTTVILLFMFVGTMFSAKPEWIKRPPRHNDPSNYYIYIAHGKGLTEDEALMNAEQDALKQAYGATGAAKDATIRHARYTYYATRDKDSFISVYGFYIIANTAENYRNADSFWGGVPSYVNKVPIRDIPPAKSKGKPQYWDNLKGASFISVEGFTYVDNFKDIGGIQDSLYQSLEKNLIAKISFPDLTVIQQNLHPDSYFDKKEKILHVIVYIRKKDIVEQYTAIIEGLLNRAENYIEIANNKEHQDEEDQDWLEIRSLYEDAQKLCDSIQETLLPQARQYFSNKKIDDKCASLTFKINNRLSIAREKSQSFYISNLERYLQTAYEAEKKTFKLATALQYYYASYIYWNEKIDDNCKELSFITKDNLKGIQVKYWLIEHIQDLLSKTQIYCVRQSKSEGKILFYWKDGIPVANIGYRYNLGSGESRARTCQNNSDYIEWRNNVERIQIRIDYQSTDQMGDRTLSNVVEQYKNDSKYDFDQYAIRTIPVQDKLSFEQSHHDLYQPHTDEVVYKIKSSAAVNPESISTNAIATKEIGNGITPIIQPAQRKPYEDIISKVCDGINKNEISPLRSYFSKKGYDQLRSLINQAPVKVRTTAQYELIQCWNEIYVRSIPATIRYKSRSHREGDLQENLVFVFDSLNLIDGIQFALDNITAEDVFSQNGWDIVTRYAILNFLENYRTAYALKRLDYIKDVFADKAVIIVGRVLKKYTYTDGPNIRYTGNSEVVKYSKQTKAQYLKNLERNFNANEWINIDFNSVSITQPKQDGYFGLNLQQDYSSQHYSDKGYLFLVVDIDSLGRPLIHLRVWTPNGSCGWSCYEKLKEMENK